jgi:hypothetical protein
VEIKNNRKGKGKEKEIEKEMREGYYGYFALLSM